MTKIYDHRGWRFVLAWEHRDCWAQGIPADVEIRDMVPGMMPMLMPNSVLCKVGRLGLSHADVEEHLRNGTLQSVNGIGPYWEAKLTWFYTYEVGFLNKTKRDMGL